MVRETWVQSQVASYQRLLKWYLIPPCLTLSNMRYVSRVTWSNPGKGVALSPTPRCSSSWKGSFLVTLDSGRQLYLLPCTPIIRIIAIAKRRGLHDVVANVLNCDIVLSEFELQLRYSAYVQLILMGKPSYPSSSGLNSFTAVLLE